MSSYKNLGQLCENPRDEGSPSLGNCPGLPANRLECAIYHTCYNSIGLCVRPILRAHSHSPPFSRMYASVAPDGDEGKRQVPPAHRLLKLLRSFLSRRLRRSRSQHLDHELALPTPRASESRCSDFIWICRCRQPDSSSICIRPAICGQIVR